MTRKTSCTVAGSAKLLTGSPRKAVAPDVCQFSNSDALRRCSPATSRLDFSCRILPAISNQDCISFEVCGLIPASIQMLFHSASICASSPRCCSSAHSLLSRRRFAAASAFNSNALVPRDRLRVAGDPRPSLQSGRQPHMHLATTARVFSEV